MKFLKLARLKYYFNIGYGETSLLKYFIAFFGLASNDVTKTMIFGVLYGLGCFIIGYIICRSGFQDAQIEVGNMFNPFVKQMRKTKLLNSKASFK